MLERIASHPGQPTAWPRGHPPALIASTASEKATAQQVLGQILAGQPNGQASAAAFARTTVQTFHDRLEIGASEPLTNINASPGDAVLVIKVYGAFPAAHPRPIGASTDATAITAVYDLASKSVITTFFTTGPEPADLTGASAPEGSVVPGVDLRDLGSPQPSILEPAAGR